VKKVYWFICYIIIAGLVVVLGAMCLIPIFIVIEGIKLSHFPGWIVVHSDRYGTTSDQSDIYRAIFNFALYHPHGTFEQRISTIYSINRSLSSNRYKYDFLDQPSKRSKRRSGLSL
jgi:hypothetical protein